MLKEHVNRVILFRSLICITFVVLLFNSNIAYAGPWYGYADVVLDYYDSGTGNMTSIFFTSQVVLKAVSSSFTSLILPDVGSAFYCRSLM